MLGAMRITALAPVVAASLAWRGPEPNLSLVVKAAFRLDRSGFVLDGDTVPLADDLPSDDDPELRYGSDFVPWKGRAEIVVVGHARAAEATRCIPVRIALGEIDKRCFALAGAEVTSVPLSSTYLRATPRGGARVRLAPMPASAPGWIDRTLPRNVDYEQFNGAANDQRLLAIEPGAELVLEGMLAGAPVFRTRVPIWRPSAFAVAPTSPADERPHLDDVGSWQPVRLTCDTLWIDVDRATALMVWRGVFPTPRGAVEVIVDAADRDLRPREVLARLEPNGAPSDTGPPPNLPEGTADLDWGEIGMKGLALPFAPKTDAPAAAARSPRERGGRNRLDTLDEATGVLDMSAIDGALPFRDSEPGRAPPPPPSAPALPRRFSGTSAMEEATGVFDFAAQGPALPFEERDPPSPPSAPTQVQRLPTSEERTGVFDFSTQGPAAPAPLPFSSSEGRPPQSSPGDWRRSATLAVDGSAKANTLPFVRGALPPHVAAALERLEELGTDVARGATLEMEAVSPSDLPFASARAPVPPNPSSPRGPLPAMPPLGVATPPAQTMVPARPAAPHAPSLPTIPMAIHGAVKAALLDGRPLTEALADHSIDERVWRLAERRLAIDLARDTPEAQELAQSLDRAIAAARRDRVEKEPGEDDELEAYLTVRAELEESDDPQRALDDLGMSREAWETMRRRWTRRALADAALAQTIRERLIAVRSSLRRVHPS
jgi:hypothetical protein